MAVEGPADEIFSKEYGYFRVSKSVQKVDLFVKVNKSKNPLSTQFWGSSKGIYIPFGKGENVFLYDEGIERTYPPERFLYFIDFLFWWPDKAWLHASGVEKNGKAYVFTGVDNVGKTSCVLNLLNKGGYNFLSDDWLIVGNGKAFPMPKRIRIFDYNLRDKELARRVLGHKRFYFVLKCKLLDYCIRLSPHRHIKFILNKIMERNILRVELCKILPEAQIAEPSPISKLFLLERKKVKHITLMKDLNAKQIARKMAYYYLFEYNRMFQEYCRYVSLFGVRNWKIENKLFHTIKVLSKTFETCDKYRVIVPHGCDLTKVDIASLFNLP